MPMTPFLTAPITPRSHKSYNNEECRQNAMKSRQENDWFGHTETSPTKSPSKDQMSPRYSNEQHRIARPSSARWWHDEDAVRVSRHDTPESRKIRQKLEANNPHDWYKHGPGVPDPPSLNSKGPKSRRSACSEARARLSSGDSNAWFKHEGKLSPKANGSATTSPSSDVSKGSLASNRRQKDLGGSISWLMNDSQTSPTQSPPKRAPCPFEIDDGSIVDTPQAKTRTISSDADGYLRRNNQGTASRWYAPQDCSATTQELEINHSRKAPIKFALRLDAESEDWYSFRDTSKSMTDLNNGRGVSPSPSGNTPMKLTRFVVNSSDDLDHQTDFMAKLDLDGSGETSEGEKRNVPDRQKWNQNQQKSQGNGFKNFVRLDDYFEPTWSVTSDDVEHDGDKL